MIELRNKQYMTVIDCVANEALEVGTLVQLTLNSGEDRPLASKLTAAGDMSTVLGPMLAHWINDRSTAVTFSGGEDGLSFPLAGASDLDALHYIPSGASMVAVGGKGVAEVRLFNASLDSEYAATLPAVGTTLEFSTDESKLCSQGNAQGANIDVAFVIENDGVSVAVVLG